MPVRHLRLPEAEREAFWRAKERLKTNRPAFPIRPRKETSWLVSEMKFWARFLGGEKMLRHAAIRAVLRCPEEGTFG
jgi:hypothetical protein